MALVTTLRMFLGETDMLDIIKDLPQSTAGFIWFFSYLVVVFLILMNVLLAIIVDSYVDAKASLSDPSVAEDMVMLSKSNFGIIYDFIRDREGFVPDGDVASCLTKLARTEGAIEKKTLRAIAVRGGGVTLEGDGDVIDDKDLDEDEVGKKPAFLLAETEVYDALLGALASHPAPMQVSGRDINPQFLKRVAKTIVGRFGGNETSKNFAKTMGKDPKILAQIDKQGGTQMFPCYYSAGGFGGGVGGGSVRGLRGGCCARNKSPR